MPESFKSPPPLLHCILGPTATGKTAMAIALARTIGGEILSADSRQIFRGMDIGTGKDLDDYRLGGSPVRHHLIDIADAGTEFSVYDYQRAFLRAYRDVTARRVAPILCGGTGLYLDAVLSAYPLVEVRPQPELRQELARLTEEQLVERLATHGPLHNTTDTRERARLVRAIEIAERSAETDTPPFPSIPSRVHGLRLSRPVLRSRIADRLDARLDSGLVAEVDGLLQRGTSPESLERYGLEYRWVTRFLRGQIDRDELRTQLLADIRRFAKRQETWFRRMERRGTPITWLDATRPAAELVAAALGAA